MKQEPGTYCSVCDNDFICKHGLCEDPDCAGSVDERGYHCSDCAEAAHEAFLSDYYGGDSPCCESSTDQMARLRREKDGIR